MLPVLQRLGDAYGFQSYYYYYYDISSNTVNYSNVINELHGKYIHKRDDDMVEVVSTLFKLIFKLIIVDGRRDTAEQRPSKAVPASQGAGMSQTDHLTLTLNTNLNPKREKNYVNTETIGASGDLHHIMLWYFFPFQRPRVL